MGVVLEPASERMERLGRRRAERVLLGPEHVDGGARVRLRRLRVARRAGAPGPSASRASAFRISQSPPPAIATASRADATAPSTSAVARDTSESARWARVVASYASEPATRSSAVCAAMPAATAFPSRTSASASQLQETAAIASVPRPSISAMSGATHRPRLLEPPGPQKHQSALVGQAPRPRAAEVVLDAERHVVEPPRLRVLAAEERQHRLPLDQLRPHGGPDAELDHQLGQEPLGL